MIKLSDVTKKYDIGGEIFYALKNISLTLTDHEFTSIIGPSGSGKSTLMHILGLLDKPSSGSVFINQKDVSTLSDNTLSQVRSEVVGFVFQQFNLLNKLTILENILLPTIYVRKPLSYDPSKKARDLIDRFGLKGKENTYPNKISGGQQQRVAIARALIMNPQLILADEPTGNLDSRSGLIILDLLEELYKSNTVSVVIITHDSDVARRTKRQITLKDGVLTEDLTRKTV